MTRKKDKSSDNDGRFRPLAPPPEHNPERAKSELAAAQRIRKRKLQFSESRMLESHLGGVLENIPGFRTSDAMTDGFVPAIGRVEMQDWVYQSEIRSGPLQTPADGHGQLRPEAKFNLGEPWVPVPDTAQVPFRCICHLEITYEGGSTATGSGWLAGPDTIVTAGHNVLNGQMNRWASEIRIVPGRNGGASGPFGDTYAKSADALEEWKTDFDPAFDLGVIKTADPNLGLATGWFGFASFTDDDLNQSPLIQSAGYPNQTKPRGTQWYDAGRAGRYSDAFMSYRLDTEEGQSGAPIFFTNNQGQRWVVATHVYGANNANLGRRVDNQIFKTISGWIN